MALDPSRQNENYLEDYELLLAAYAFGALDMAQSLAVAAHLTFSPNARRFVRLCEALGGNMMERDCTPAPMSQTALERILGVLGAPDEEEFDHGQEPALGRNYPEDLHLPGVLQQALNRCPQPFYWKTVLPGLRRYDLDVPAGGCRARVMQIDPTARIPYYSHDGLEITLVLKGAYGDRGNWYERGDLCVVDGTGHAPQPCPKRGCVSLVVTGGQVRLGGWKRMFNPLFRKIY